MWNLRMYNNSVNLSAVYRLGATLWQHRDLLFCLATNQLCTSVVFSLLNAIMMAEQEYPILWYT